MQDLKSSVGTLDNKVEEISNLSKRRDRANWHASKNATRCFQIKSELLQIRLAITRLDLSARAYHRVPKLARSIANLEDSATVASRHIAEAVQYRRMDKN